MKFYCRLAIIPSLLLMFAVETKPKAGASFRWPEGKRAALSLTFDDARPSQLDVGVPLFERQKVKATFFVSPARMRERVDGWKKAAAGGHEIANHSMTHPCSGNFPFSRQGALEELGLDRMRSEMLDANAAIEQTIGVTPRTFAYPCGQKFVGRGKDLKSYVPLVAELFTAGRGWMDEAANDPAFCDLSQLFGVPSDNVEFAALRPMLEQALQQGSWLVLAGHDIGDSPERQTTQASMLEELCRYASDPARGLWVDTFGTVASYVARQRAARAATTGE